MNGTTVFLTAIAYVSVLFLIAWWGDRGGRRFVSGVSRAYVYALSLAVYCTSWTYYGSVGLASEHGLDFLPIYIGPILVIGLGAPLVGRIAKLARAQNVTTVADFVSARYGKSQSVAAVAALIVLVGSAPYIALQLKAVATTLLTVVNSFDQSRLAAETPSTAFYLAISMVLAAFAMAFGTRRINPKEQQNGLILAIAVESIVKLAAFLAVGAFVVWKMNGGLADLTEVVRSTPRIAEVIQTPPNPGVWGVTTLLSAIAIVLLPRQFHVAIVENHDQRDIRTASWLFPLYLVLINLFVAPLAIAGLKTFPDGGINRDLTVLALPLAAGAHRLALFTMIGGISAATGMVVLDSLALAITISNDLVMPLLLRRRVARGRAANGDIGALVLWVRRAAILGVLALGFGYERLAGQAGLVAIGLLSFAAVAQIAPAFLGALFWRRGTSRGAIAGMTAGSFVWVYLLLLPSIGAHELAQYLPGPGPPRDRLAETRCARRLCPERAGGRRHSVAGGQYFGLRRLFPVPSAERARTHPGERIRGSRRKASGVPAVALIDHRRRTRGRGRALSGSSAGARRLFCLRWGERPRLRPLAGGERAADPPRGISVVARDRRIDLAPGAVAASEASRRFRQIRAETD